MIIVTLVNEQRRFSRDGGVIFWQATNWNVCRISYIAILNIWNKQFQGKRLMGIVEFNLNFWFKYKIERSH